MSKVRTSLENYTLLLVELQKMRSTIFKPRAFLKKIRPFCRTSHIGFSVLFVRIRGANVGITIHVKSDCFIVQQNGSLHEFIFYCTSQKQLITKLLKHNLLTY